jgi:hypothetical protein
MMWAEDFILLGQMADQKAYFSGKHRQGKTRGLAPVCRIG